MQLQFCCLALNPIEWCNANQGFVMAALTATYVIATLWLAIIAIRGNALSRRQLALTAELERNRTRPFVIFDLITDKHFVFARIKNTGQTAAVGVEIDISPPVKALLGGKNSFPPQEREKEIPFIARGVAMMAPDRSITGLVGHWARVKDHHKDLRFNGSIKYRDATGAIYDERFVIDLGAEEGLMFLGIKDIDDVAKQLETISKTLDHIASGFSKPLVRTMSESEYRKEEEEFIRQAEEGLRKNQPPPENRD